jgi:hypothetical protein
MNQEFEWDEQKSKINLNKHGISFDFAELLFFEDYLCQYDDRFNYGEDRFQAIGEVYGIVLFVTYTVVNQEKIRLISARKATKKERKIWEEYYYE